MDPATIAAMISTGVELVTKLTAMYAEAQKNTEATPEELATADAQVEAAHAALQAALAAAKPKP